MILVPRDDGGVSIIVLAPGSVALREVEKWAARNGVPVLQWTEIEMGDVPPDRTFRDAWATNGANVHVDMPRARDIHLERIRRVRDRVLAATDGEVARELEGGGVGADLKARRQALRDIPQTLNLSGASTPDELKATWPSEIERRAVRRV